MHHFAIALLLTFSLLAPAIPSISSKTVQPQSFQKEVSSQLSRYDSIKLDASSVAVRVRQSGKLSLATSGRTFDLTLFPNDIRSENYRVDETGRNAVTFERAPIYTYKGSVQNIAGSQARFTIDDNHVEGLIITPEGNYFLEPASRYSSSAQAEDYVIYKDSDVIQADSLACPFSISNEVKAEAARIDSSPGLSSLKGGLDAVSPMREVELATEADNEYVQIMGSEGAANNQILSIVNMVDGIYQAEIGLTFKVVFQRAWSSPDPYSDTTDVVALLNELQSQWNSKPPAGAPTRDLVHMWTGKATNSAGFAFGGRAGVANDGVVCRDSQFRTGSASYSLSRASGNPTADVVIPSHEIGHNFGASHPDQESTPHPECAVTIMNSDATNSLKTFCQFSRDQITNYVNGTSGVNNPIPNNNCLSVATAPPPTIQFSTNSYRAVEETDRSVQIVVTRSSGSGNSIVSYATVNQSASERSDFTTARGTLFFSAGETTKTFDVLITNDVYFEGPETVGLLLSSPGGGTLGAPSSATLTIISGDAADGSSPVKDPSFDNDFFVRQHYQDFFNRLADAGGLSFWVGQLAECEGKPAAERQPCRDVRRVNVSAAFFLSIEFQETGFYVIRMQRAAFGLKSNTAGGRVSYYQLIGDAGQVAKGVIVGQPGYENVLEQNKQNYAAGIVASPAFEARFSPNLSANDYVNALFASAGVSPSGAEVQEAIAAFGGGGAPGRVAALRKVADSNSVRQAELNPTFVLMQYFGYLRRNPTDAPNSDDSGYQFWLGKLNQFNGNFVGAEMVKAFITSDEYQKRFGL